MALTTAQNYLYHAFRTCGEMRAGYTPSPEMLQDGLDQWWLFFDGLNTMRTTAYSQPDYLFAVTAPGHGTTGNGQTYGGTGYTIGPTAVDFPTPGVPRPPAISRMNLYYQQGGGPPARLPIAPLSMEEWMGIVVLELTPVNVATVFAYDPQWPNGVIWIWPPMVGNSLEIFTWGSLVPPTALSSPFSAPPGYGDLLVFNLASRLYPYCDKAMYNSMRSEQWVRGQAEIARQRVMAMNSNTPRLRNDFRAGNPGGARGGYSDWELLLTGT